MIIDKLKVKNYKSLEDVEVPLRSLTVLVGPNNAGKSNTLDCIEFLKDLAYMGPPAVGRRNGFHDIVWGGDLGRAIDIRLEGWIGDGRPQRPFAYEVGVSGGQIAYSISKEIFKLRADSREVKLLELSGDRQWVTWSEEDPGQQTGAWGWSEQRLAIRQMQGSQDRRHLSLAAFASAVADWTLYRLVPSRLGSASPARKESYLMGEGENLATVLLTIQSEDRKAFQELESYLKAAVPEIEEFSVGLTEDQRAYPRWRELGLPSGFMVNQWMSSDGTRQILALLALRFAPRLPHLVCIEEPENFIHAGLLEFVADLLRSISKKTQLLVTTHSPYLVDHLSPDDLLIVEKTDGKTRVRGISESESVKEAVKVLGLGELWYSGAIGGTP